jgi:hypothetical protein
MMMMMMMIEELVGVVICDVVDVRNKRLGMSSSCRVFQR